eukprot:SAG11_NODE_4258_length_1983_cov_9.871019_1_plen_343_part_10
MSADKVRTILDMPLPNQNQTQIRGFVGMASFYRRFISDFSAITKPLTDLLKKGVDVAKEWKPEHTESVQKLKLALTTYPVLRQFDMRKPLYLVTDASDYAVGACLYQLEKQHPVAIAYTSKCLNPAELNYSVQEKEALGVIHGVEKFRHYLLGSPFTIEVLSDHQSLTYLQTGKEKGGRMARWAIKLSEYNYKIRYIKGKDNGIADLLSRLVSAPRRGPLSSTLETESLANVFTQLAPSVCVALMSGETQPTNVSKDAIPDRSRSGRNQDPDDHDTTQYETALFYRARVKQVHVTVKPSDYKSCPDYCVMYAMISGQPMLPEMASRLERQNLVRARKRSSKEP